MQHHKLMPPTSDSLKWDSPIIALAGVISAAFLLFCYYKLLTTMQCCEFRPRRRLNDHVADEPSSEIQSRGLDSGVMHSLPVTQFKKTNNAFLIPSIKECAVCLGEFEDGEWIKQLPSCSHVFHVACIDIWLQAHSSCPLCRTYVYSAKLQLPESSVSVDAMPENLGREETSQHRSSHNQNLWSQVLQSTNPGNGQAGGLQNNYL